MKITLIHLLSLYIGVFSLSTLIFFVLFGITHTWILSGFGAFLLTMPFTANLLSTTQHYIGEE